MAIITDLGTKREKEESCPFTEGSQMGLMVPTLQNPGSEGKMLNGEGKSLSVKTAHCG
jgi:hypothetical protein